MAITIHDIHAAADRICAQGGNPTVPAIRSAIGGGTWTTISEAMESWKPAGLAGIPADRELPPAVIAGRMAELASEIWSMAHVMATTRLQIEREELEAERAEFWRTRAEASEFAGQLEAELEAVKWAHEAARLTLAEKTRELEQSQTRVEHQADEITVLAQALNKADCDARESAAALAGARAHADQLAVLLEKERSERAAALQERSEAEQSARESAQALELARKEQAALQAMLEAARARIDAASVQAERAGDEAQNAVNDAVEPGRKPAASRLTAPSQ